MKLHNIQFPPINAENLNQDEAFFYLLEETNSSTYFVVRNIFVSLLHLGGCTAC